MTGPTLPSLTSVRRKWGTINLSSLAAPSRRSWLAHVEQLVIQAGDGKDAINLEGLAGSVFTWLVLPSSSDRIIVEGGSGDDQIRGSDLDEKILAGSGDDVVFAGGGNDWIEGEAGRDFLQGEGGDDVAVGGDDADQMWGGEGNDVLAGGTGDDLLVGDGGDDHLVGGGTETIRCSAWKEMTHSVWLGITCHR